MEASTGFVHALLVEDNEDDYAAANDLFMQTYPEGYRLDWAKTSSEALAKISAVLAQ